MDSMVTFAWQSKDYLVPSTETISILGKPMVMPEVTSGGFAPQVSGVGKMKLEATP